MLIRGPDSGSERGRLMVYWVMFGVVTLGLVMSWYSAQDDPGGKPPPPEQQVLIALDETVDPQDPFKAVTPEKELYDRAKSMLLRMPERAVWRDQRLLSEPLGFVAHWLAGQSHKSLAASAWSRTHWNYNKIMRDPRRWTTQVLHVYGELVDIHEEAFDGMPTGLSKLYRLTLYDTRKNWFYSVLTPVLPQNASKLIPASNERRFPVHGTMLAADAVFIWGMEVNFSLGWERTPIFFAKRVVRAQELGTAYPLLDTRGDPGVKYQEIQPTTTIRTAIEFDRDPGDQHVINLKHGTRTYPIYAPSRGARLSPGIGGIRAQDPREIAQNLRSEKSALNLLFAWVYGYTSAELKEKENPAVSYAGIMAPKESPLWMHGQVTTFVGKAGDIETMEFSNASVGISRIHLITGFDMRYKDFDKFTWRLAVLNIPKGLRENDRIEARGVFVKRIPYKTPGQKWHWAPLLVCRAVRIIGPDKTATWIYAVVIGGIVMVLLIAQWATRRDNRRMENIRDRIEGKRIAHRQARGEIKPVIKSPAAVRLHGMTPNEVAASIDEDAATTAEPISAETPGDESTPTSSATPADTTSPTDESAPENSSPAADSTAPPLTDLDDVNGNQS